MNSRLILNLVLLVSIVIIGTFIYQNPDKTENNIVRLGGPEIDDISNVLIQRDGLADIHLQKKPDGHWWMTNPYKVRANKVPIDALLRLREAISHSRFSSLGKNLADYDLLPAKASLHLNDEEYLFGNIEHISKRRYMLKDSTVHLTTDLFYHRLRTNTESFISPRLIPDNAEITALKLPGLELNKSAQGDWMLSGEQSTAKDISADAIQALLDHWQNKQAIQVLPAKPASSQQTVLVTFADNSAISFTLNKSDKELILIRADLGLQYHLPAGADKDLLKLTNPAGS